MSKGLKIDAEKLADEVTWLNKMPTVEPVSAVTQINLVLGALILRRISADQYRESVLIASGGDQSTVLVSTAKLLTALKPITGDVVLTISDDGLSIESEERSVTLKAADGVVDFPKWPQFNGLGKEVLTSQKIAQVLTSVSTDDALPALTTVAFDGGTMVATDRHRLTRVAYGTKGFTGKVYSTALQAFAKADSAVFVEPGASEGKDWIQLRLNGRSVTTPMADVSFPNWRKLIPEDQPLQVALSRRDLIKAVTGDTVTLTVDGDALTVVGESDGVRTEQKVKLFQTVKNELDGPISVVISSKYVRDCLRALESGLVLFCITDADKPVIFQDITERDVHLVMPIKQAS